MTTETQKPTIVGSFEDVMRRQPDGRSIFSVKVDWDKVRELYEGEVFVVCQSERQARLAVLYGATIATKLTATRRQVRGEALARELLTLPSE
jgi:hypothetical protein